MDKINFLENLSFLDDKVIYLESDYSEAINSFISENYSWIQETAAQKGITFIYLPAVFGSSTSDRFLKDYIGYHYPGDSTEFVLNFISVQDQLTTNKCYSLFAELLNHHNHTGCGLFYNRVSKVYQNSNNYFWFSLDESNDIKVQLDSFFRFSFHEDYPNIQSLGVGDFDGADDTADSNFEIEANKVAEDIISKIEYLKKEGMNALLAEIAIRMFGQTNGNSIKSLGKKHDDITLNLTVLPTLSRLRIEWTSKYDFDIILPDYGNRIVEMPRLPKALYYFFLQHPEGVMLNSLCDYKDELLYIYRRVSNKTDINEIIKNIERLTDPLDNSVNVNCSRIKSAFVRLIADDLAKNYYITGDRCFRKRITLASRLIEIVN